MKKFILFAAVLFSAVTLVNAQTSNEGTAELTINLKAVQSITVNGNVVIDYDSAEDYANGVTSSVMQDHLSVVSAGGFTIRVSAPDLTNDGSDIIKASSIKVVAKGSKKTDGVVANDAGVSLNNDPVALISSTNGGVGKTFNVTYTGDSENAYINNYNAEGSQTYTTTVTYTIAAS